MTNYSAKQGAVVLIPEKVSGGKSRFDGVQALRVATVAAVVCTLGACASAHVTGVARLGGQAAPPAAILVVVTTDAAAKARAGVDQGKIAIQLRSDVVARLSKAGVAAGPLMAGPIPEGDAVLRIAIAQADAGNKMERLLVGFGAGKSSLAIRATLDNPSRASSMLAFSSTSDSGRRPGLILPAGVAAATGKAVHLVIGGVLDLGLTARSGLDRNADSTASAIVGQIKSYYASSGWGWPT